MNTFEITIQRKADDGWPVTAEQSRPGSFLPVRSEGLLTFDLEQLLAARDSAHYGQQLGEALFCNGIRDGFTRALADSNNNMRVLLFVEADDLRGLRWDRLWAPLDNQWRALARNAQALYSLYLPSVTDSRFPAIGRRDLRALIIAASPEGLDRYGLASFDLASEIMGITEALGEIPADILASGPGLGDHPTLRTVGPASLDALCERLTQEKYTLLHVVTHALYNQRTGDSALLLANARGQVERVPASDFIDRLRKLRGARGLPHLTFLATCEQASPTADGALGYVGQGLVRDLGMPAVLAQLEKMPTAAARGLTKTFYAQLRQHGEVDRALVEAGAGSSQIALPILYSRLGGRPLFSDQLAQDRALTNAEIQFGLQQLRQLLPARAPVLVDHVETLAAQLQSSLGAEIAALTPTLREERETALAAIEAITSEVLDFGFAALALGQEPPAYDERCPYLGLAAFHAEQRSFFFGREALVTKLVNRLNEHNFLAVLGGSGSGKSSLVLAGVAPALQLQNPTLAVHYLTPTNNPVAQLDKVLAEVDPTHPQVLVVDQFEELFTLCTDPAQRQQFVDRLFALLVEPKSKIENRKSKIILTMRADFWGECASYPNLRERMQVHQELVAPMTAQELRSSMEQQARVVGLRFETDLSNTILDDVAGEPGAMPLLQHALLELWKRRHGRWLRADEYRNLGGVHQAIARTADSIYHELDDADRERMRTIFLRLTRLDDGNQEGETQRDTRRRARFDELAAAGDEEPVRALVQRLADARLVVTTVRETTPQPPPNLPRGGGTGSSLTRSPLPPRGEGWGGASFVEVEVTHEALIRHWPRLRTWLDEGRTALRLRQSLSNDAAQWDFGDRADTLLPRWNARLEETQRLALNPRFGLNQLEQAYLNACVALRDREAAEKEAQRQRELQQAQALAAEQRQRAEEQAQAAANLRKRAVLLAAAGALAVLLAVAAGWFGVRAQRSEAVAVDARNVADQRRQEAEAAKVEADTQRDKAETQAALARSRELGVLAENAGATGNLDLAMLLRIEGARTAPTPEMINAVRSLLAEDKRTSLRLPGHSSPVTQAQWNGDESQLLIAYADGSAGVWSYPQGKELLNLANQDARINIATWSPNEQQLLTGSDDGWVRVWDAASGAKILEITADPTHVSVARWNADSNRILTAGDDGTARIWDAFTGEQVVSMTGHSGLITAVAWNADESRVLTGGKDGTARIWDALTGEQVITMTGHTGLITAVAWNADESRVLTASDDQTARVWDADTGEALYTLAGHTDRVTDAAWSPDGSQILTASLDHTARLWDAKSGTELLQLAGHNDAVRQALWSHDGLLVLTISADKTARVWDASTGDLLFALVGHTDKLNQAQWSADDQQLLTASDDGTVRIWAADEGNHAAGELPVLARHSGRVNHLIWNATQTQLLTTGLDDGNAQIVDIASGQTLVTLDGHGEGINDAQWSPQGDLVLTASTHGSARIWDATTGKEIWRVEQAKSILTARWSPDGATILTASEDGTAMLWNASTGKALRMLRGHGNGVTQAIWNHDGSRILTASMDDTARLWDAKTGQQLLKLNAHTADVTLAFWNQAESRIFTASDDGTVKVWDAQSGKVVLTLVGHTDVIKTVRLNATETRLVTASQDGTARVWALQSGQELLKLTHSKAVKDVRWNPTEDSILTASEDETTKIWDATSGQEIATLPSYGQIVRQALWNEDGSRILTASDDGRVRQFYLQPDAVVTAACERGAVRNMSHDEWSQFMAEQSYRATCTNLPVEGN